MCFLEVKQQLVVATVHCVGLDCIWGSLMLCCMKTCHKVFCINEQTNHYFGHSLTVSNAVVWRGQLWDFMLASEQQANSVAFKAHQLWCYVVHLTTSRYTNETMMCLQPGWQSWGSRFNANIKSQFSTYSHHTDIVLQFADPRSQNQVHTLDLGRVPTDQGWGPRVFGSRIIC